MKIWNKILIPFLITGLISAAGCKEKKGLARYQETVENSSAIDFYEIDEFPTEKSAQSTEKKYVEDFEIKKQINLNPNQVDSLKKIAADWTNYDTSSVKSCPFLPHFALQFSTKTDAIRLIVGVSPCGRVQLTGSNNNFENKTVELVADSPLEKWLIQNAPVAENL